MSKKDMVCFFSHRSCQDCAIYRGRHYYLGLCRGYNGYNKDSNENINSGISNKVDFQPLRNWMEPWAARGDQLEIPLEIKLKVIDMESGESRICELSEAKTWDWSDPKLVRVIGDIQVTGWDKLVEIVRFKAKKGYHEVEIYEAPRFMLLAGG